MDIRTGAALPMGAPLGAAMLLFTLSAVPKRRGAALAAALPAAMVLWLRISTSAFSLCNASRRKSAHTSMRARTRARTNAPTQRAAPAGRLAHKRSHSRGRRCCRGSGCAAACCCSELSCGTCPLRAPARLLCGTARSTKHAPARSGAKKACRRRGRRGLACAGRVGCESAGRSCLGGSGLAALMRGSRGCLYAGEPCLCPAWLCRRATTFSGSFGWV